MKNLKKLFVIIAGVAAFHVNLCAMQPEDSLCNSEDAQEGSSSGPRPSNALVHPILKHSDVVSYLASFCKQDVFRKIEDAASVSKDPILHDAIVRGQSVCDLRCKTDEEIRSALFSNIEDPAHIRLIVDNKAVLTSENEIDEEISPEEKLDARFPYLVRLDVTNSEITRETLALILKHHKNLKELELWDRENINNVGIIFL